MPQRQRPCCPKGAVFTRPRSAILWPRQAGGRLLCGHDQWFCWVKKVACRGHSMPQSTVVKTQVKVLVDSISCSGQRRREVAPPRSAGSRRPLIPTATAPAGSSSARASTPPQPPAPVASPRSMTRPSSADTPIFITCSCVFPDRKLLLSANRGCNEPFMCVMLQLQNPPVC